MAIFQTLLAVFLLIASITLFIWVWRALLRRHIARGRSRLFGHFLGATVASVIAPLSLAAVVPSKSFSLVFSVSTFAFVGVVFLVVWKIPPKASCGSPKFVGRKSPTMRPQESVTQQSVFLDLGALAIRKRPSSRALNSDLRQTAFKPATAAKPVSRRKAIDEIQFSYCDYNGSHTDRRVAVQLVDGEHFQGYCFLRSANRTFRFENIIGPVIRISTGEILTVDEWRLEVTK